MQKPLEGLLVVALEQAVAAPFCTMRLADAGARVIKLERPEGDFGRGYDDVAMGQSSYFVWLNRGKESVVVNLRAQEDRSLFEALVAKADVFVHNLKPGALERIGYNIDALCRENRRLIACSISGYGETGPMAQRKAYDLLVQAESGLASITGGPSEAARVGFSIVDIATGAVAVQAVLEALYCRTVTGKGTHIRLSMFDTIVEWMAVPFLHAAQGRPPKRIGLAHPSIAPYGVFRSEDGKPILISIQNEREWVALCERVLGDAAIRSCTPSRSQLREVCSTCLLRRRSGRKANGATDRFPHSAHTAIPCARRLPRKADGARQARIPELWGRPSAPRPPVNRYCRRSL